MSRHGLDTTYLGNADLYGEGQWTHVPPTADGHAAPLPTYPQESDLPPSPSKLRDFALAVVCTAMTLSSFVGVYVIGAYINGWRPC